MSLINPELEQRLRRFPMVQAPGGNYAPQPYSRQPVFQPRPSIPQGAPNWKKANQQAQLDRQRALLGSAADILAPAGGQPLRRQDIPLLEAGLNFENLQRAEEDRARGFEELARGRGAVGMDPSSQLAREVAMRRVSQGNDLKTQRASALKDRTAVATQDALRQLQQEQAQGGVYSSSGGFLNRAMLPQRAAIELSGQLSDLDFQQEEADRAALGDLTGITSREDAMRAAFDEMLANLFLETERGPVDLSGLLEPQGRKKGLQYV
jgi:hypothetical protein